MIEAFSRSNQMDLSTPNQAIGVQTVGVQVRVTNELGDTVYIIDRVE